MINRPLRMDLPLAVNGDKVVIPVTNNPVEGRFSQNLGFPPITALPLDQGGIAPYLEDFNGAYNLLAQHVFWKQSGGMYEYDEDLNYPVQAIITLENKYWRCLQPNGPGYAVGAKSPLSQPDYWAEVIFGNVNVTGPGQGLYWGIAPTGKLWKQSEMPGIVATTPGDMYTNHQDVPQITVGQSVQLPPDGTWWVSWMEVKSTPTESGGYDDSLGITMLRGVLGRAYPGATLFTPQNPVARIYLDAWRIL